MSTTRGTVRLHAGSQPARPCSRTGPGSPAKARTDPGARLSKASTGPATTPAEASRASRPTVLATTVRLLGAG